MSAIPATAKVDMLNNIYIFHNEIVQTTFNQLKQPNNKIKSTRFAGTIDPGRRACTNNRCIWSYLFMENGVVVPWMCIIVRLRKNQKKIKQ